MFGLENSNHSFMNRSGTKLETNFKIVTGIVLNLISDTACICFEFALVSSDFLHFIRLAVVISLALNS